MWEIYVMETDGTNVQRLTSNNCMDRFPSWSPDGKELLFASTRPPSPGAQPNLDVYRMNSDGTQQRLLTADSLFLDTLPAWNPFAGTFLFTTNRHLNNSEIYSMDLLSASAVNLTNDSSYDSDAAWAPGGSRRIAFTSTRNGGFDIFVMDQGAAIPQRITNNPGEDSHPDWSPDGRYIVFQSSRGGNFDLWVFDTDQNTLTQLTTDAPNETDPTWSPDGREIAFVTNRHGPNNDEIYKMNADGSGAPVRLTNNTVEDGSPDWSLLFVP